MLLWQLLRVLWNFRRTTGGMCALRKTTVSSVFHSSQSLHCSFIIPLCRYTKELKDLILMMLTVDPDRRPDIDAVIAAVNRLCPDL